MGVQTKILKRMETFDLADGVTLKSGTGALVGGEPGQIYDVAYGPVCHTTNLETEADIGSYVKGRGIIINAPEYALYGTRRNAAGEGGPLAPSLTLPANTVVSVMTAGHVWVLRGELEAIQNGMNTFIIYEPEGTDANDLCVVEVNGLKEYAGGDSTTEG